MASQPAPMKLMVDRIAMSSSFQDVVAEHLDRAARCIKPDKIEGDRPRVRVTRRRGAALPYEISIRTRGDTAEALLERRPTQEYARERHSFLEDLRDLARVSGEAELTASNLVCRVPDIEVFCDLFDRVVHGHLVKDHADRIERASIGYNRGRIMEIAFR